eukprot:g5148.t1
MFLAFGVMLPCGAFLAYTGYHRKHVYVQVSAVFLGIVGAVLAFAYVGRRSGEHAHHWVGFLVLVLATVVQPYLITHKMYTAHHRNGVLVTTLGLLNGGLGISLLGLRRTFVVMYAFLVSLQVIFVAFDPLHMRSSRMIAMGVAKQHGESTVVELRSLLQRAPGTRLRRRRRADVLPGDVLAAGGAAKRGEEWHCAPQKEGAEVVFTAPSR